MAGKRSAFPKNCRRCEKVIVCDASTGVVVVVVVDVVAVFVIEQERNAFGFNADTGDIPVKQNNDLMSFRLDLVGFLLC